MLDIRAVAYDSAEAVGLTRAALLDLSERYGGEGDSTPVAPEQFAPPLGGFFIVYVEGAPAGCGGWRSRELDGEPVAEVKRMYVAPQYRGRGAAMAILRRIEQDARQAGRVRTVLETGGLQPEAIALYQKAGYLRIPDFGHYKDEPDVLSFGFAL